MRLIFATGNKDKMREIREIMGGLDMEILSMKEAGIDVDIEENGTTFEENAVIKVKTIGAMADTILMADDSGLAVDALGGAPGVYSARFMGRDTSYSIKNQAIIDRLEGLEGEARGAQFVCSIAAMFPDGTVKTETGVMEGQIGFREAGANGFGYDPIFYLPQYGMTSAEIPPEEKNAISHRGQALRKMRPEVEKWIREHQG